MPEYLAGKQTKAIACDRGVTVRTALGRRSSREWPRTNPATRGFVHLEYDATGLADDFSLRAKAVRDSIFLVYLVHGG